MDRNNNAGGVSQGRSGLASSVRNNTAPQQARPANNATALGAIAEDDEVEDGDGEERDNDDDDGEEEEDVNNGGSIDGVPQAFSHFTWDCTGGQKLVCDLQVRAGVCGACAWGGQGSQTATFCRFPSFH